MSTWPPVIDLRRERPLRLAVFVSGGGTTLQNLLDRCHAGVLAAEVVVVVSGRAGVAALDRAAAAGVPAFVAAATDALNHAERAGADVVVLAGYLSRVPVPPEWAGRIVNVHPSLIPAFSGKGCYGDRVHTAVLERGVKVSGCTVHLVDGDYDHGPILVQRTVPVEDGDDVPTLQRRVFAAECDALPAALELLRTRRLRLVGRRVVPE